MICLFEDYTLNPSSSLYLNLALKNKCKGLLIKLQASVVEVKGQNISLDSHQSWNFENKNQELLSVTSALSSP